MLYSNRGRALPCWSMINAINGNHAMANYCQQTPKVSRARFSPMSVNAKNSKERFSETLMNFTLNTSHFPVSLVILVAVCWLCPRPQHRMQAGREGEPWATEVAADFAAPRNLRALPAGYCSFWQPPAKWFHSFSCINTRFFCRDALQTFNYCSHSWQCKIFYSSVAFLLGQKPACRWI